MSTTSWPFMEGLPTETTELLLSVSRERKYRRGEALFMEGERGISLHMVTSGALLAEGGTLDGDMIAYSVSGPGDVMGEMALLADGEGEPRSATVRAIGGSAETLELPRRDFNRLRDEHPAVDRFLVLLLDKRVRRLSNLLIEFRHLSAHDRVRSRLVELVEVFGSSVPLGQERLASLAFTTRPTVNELLQELQNEGIVEVARQKVIVHDVDRLAPDLF